MAKFITTLFTVGLLLPLFPGVGATASSEESFFAAREDDLRALTQGDAPPDRVGALLAVATAPDSPPEALFAAARAAHALHAAGASPEEAAALAEGALLLRLRAEATAAFEDPAAIERALAEGSLDRDTLAAIGFSPEGLTARADLFAAFGGPDADATRALVVALPTPPTVWEQETWDTYGLALEVAYLLIATQSSELAGWILPHDIRVFATYVNLKTVGPVSEGNVNNGRIWTQVYVDTIVGLAMDNHGFADAMVLQLPITVYAEVNWRCTQTLFGVCIAWSFGAVGGPGDTLIATDATYTFAYPANGGEFPTRVTGQDVLQSVYDRLGMLPHAAPTDFSYRSQMAGTPGVADLSTQAPLVTFYGFQVSPELEPIRATVKHVRVHAPAPYVVADDVAGQGPLHVGPYNVGPTAGYTAREVHGYEITWLIVRWHNVGVESSGLLPSSPATFYYDVPAGAYKLTNARVDAYDGVLVTDWALAGDLPATPAAPAVPAV